MKQEGRPGEPGEVLALRIEALLFAAGGPLTVHEIVGTLGAADFKEVHAALRHLRRNYASRQTALELCRAGDGWAIQVKKSYLPTARAVASAEIPRRALKTLALIAYHQPVLQSRLVRMVGVSVYEDVPVLREGGFVRASERMNSLELTTTGRFAEYFGFETTDKDKLKRLLGKSLGVKEAPAGSPAAPEEDPAGAPTPSSEGDAAPALRSPRTEAPSDSPPAP